MTPDGSPAAPRAAGRGTGQLTLHTYFRSSASFRVRIALALKGLPWEAVPVHLVRGGGEQRREDFLALNPSGLVPVLRDRDVTVTQSLAIIEYLEELQPEPNLIGRTAAERARVRSLSLDIACEIHPLNNLRVLRYLTHDLKVAEDEKNRWYRHWVETGLEVVERQLAEQPGTYCHGDTPTLADCTLVPQVVNAQRFDCRLDHVPNVMRVFAACMRLDAFSQTQPSACPDAQG